MKNIAILTGDGIGPEVMKQALRVLDVVANKFNHTFNCQEGMIGGTAYEECGTHFPEDTMQLCQSADAILFGSVGGPISEQHLEKWKGCEANSILALRNAFSFNVNVRPIKVYTSLTENSPLQSSIITKGVDCVIFRELLGDIYFGEHKQEINNGERFAYDIATYSESQIASIAHRAFQFARKRKQKVTSVDKANVLATSKLWREVVSEVGHEYPDVQLEHMLVDNCAMQLVINPAQFDVILAGNMFGDILSDIGAGIPGSLGLMPSVSFNANGFALYEPAGGSAPEIAGKNQANPIAQILSASLMLRYSFAMDEEASAIETAVELALNNNYRTADICTDSHSAVSTTEFTDEVIGQIG